MTTTLRTGSRHTSVDTLLKEFRGMSSWATSSPADCLKLKAHSLAVATPPETAKKNRVARRTHCKRGHQYTESNTRWVPNYRVPSGQSRECRDCIAIRKLKYRSQETTK